LLGECRPIVCGPLSLTPQTQTDLAAADAVAAPDEVLRVDPTTLPEFVNRPDRFNALGLAAWREGLRDLVAGIEICTSLIRRDIASRYRQSLLGVGWAVLTPLAMVSVFFFLDRADLMNGGETATPKALWLYVGLLPWQFFQASLTRTTQSLTSQPQLVGRVRFPREILVFAALGGALFDFVLGLVVLALFFVGFGVLPAWTIAFVPLLLVLQLMLSAAFGMVLGVLNGALRDLGSVVPLLALLWMFLTPIVYTPAIEGPGTILNWINPMTPIIVTWRDLLLDGTVTMPLQLAVVFVVTCIALPLGWRFFHVFLPRVTESI
jgi:lipopolysaccharide transport system permease protein